VAQPERTPPPVAIDPEDIAALTPEERGMLDALLTAGRVWTPYAGPQTMAYKSKADIVGFGGAAGGGKTDLAIGLALTQHQRVGIFRQNGTELTAIIDRCMELLHGRDGYNGSERIWRTLRADNVPVQIEFGSFPTPGEEAKYRGRPHDLLVFDEAAEMRETAVRFLLGWLRTTDPKQRCRSLLCFNPPTTVEGRWILAFFAPWLDKKHPNPAQPGELRWFASIDGKDVEVDSGAEFMHEGELVQPMSRTFVPSRITDNPSLLHTGYMRQLQSMPEPLRSQLLYGDFQAGVEDDPFQVIPTRWVEAAMARWKHPSKLPVMDSVGVDVALGGRDNTVIARRHGMWFDEPVVYTGVQSKDGPIIAGYIIAHRRDDAVIHIDLFGVGAQPYGHLMAVGVQVVGVNVGEPARGVSKQGTLQFKNWRSELWWRMREALDPALNTGIELPPDKTLLSDLCAPTWKLVGHSIAVASRDEIVERIGRSPDVGTAYVLGLMDTPKRAYVARATRGQLPGQRESHGEYDPYAHL
jgi:hypothetical protein